MAADTSSGPMMFHTPNQINRTGYIEYLAEEEPDLCQLWVLVLGTFVWEYVYFFNGSKKRGDPRL